MIWHNDVIGITDDIWQNGTTETTIDNGVARKISLYILPFCKGRATNQQDGVFRRKCGTVHFFEPLDIVIKSSLLRTHCGSNEDRQQKDNEVLYNLFHK